ncbi:MAG: ankyrin repeat domain-containing protein [Verrucomicrobiaceae bacterium]|nr:MAG: ankyrin repeat domain-containing protein [Verrucomicrobiaceae bacterium]
MPHRHLPKSPNLRHLRDQARDLLRGHQTGDPASLHRIREFHPGFRHLTDERSKETGFRLADAQLTIAREYAFESWPKLKSAIESGSVPDESLPFKDRIADPLFREAVCQIDAGDVEGLRRLLAEDRQLARQRVYISASDYFGQPSLLQFVAQNPVRQESMPRAVEIAQAILDAGPSQADVTDTLGLIATGRVPRENGVQEALIDLLCRHGARVENLDGVLAHGEFAAAEALLRHGARLTLPAAAALGRLAEFEKLLPSASPDDRHLGLALAAQFGRVPILKRLLGSGEDPNRYNPPGAHAHSTPLHQAVIHGQEEAVRLLLSAGARKDIRDTLFQGTALGWAEYAKLPTMVELLRDHSR